jgi:hypothetical protein
VARRVVLVLSLVCFLFSAEAAVLASLHPHQHSSEHCCGLCHVGPLPFLQPAVWRAFDPGILAAWLERFRDLDAPREVAHASAHSRAPPA